MIALYFGLPGAGKTTLACKLLIDATNKYKNVYANFKTKINGVTYIDNDCIGKYDLSESFVVIDEAQLFANCRDTKSFSYEQIEQFVLHRHDKMDIAILSQRTNGHDKIIRELTCDCYYLYKSFPLGFWQTKYYRIPYKIMIPDAKSGSSRVGEILMGYYQPPALVKLFAKRIWRPKYYKYFDSFETVHRPQLPSRYKAYYGINVGLLSSAFDTVIRSPFYDIEQLPELENGTRFSLSAFNPVFSSKIS